MFPQGAHTPSSRGNLWAWDTFHMHTDLLRIVHAHGKHDFIQRKSPFHGVQNGLFRYRYSVPDMVWSIRAKLSLEANESAKSPSPSLAGQSVIVNQAGLLAPVHRSSASSQRSLPSDCRLSSTCEITPCYSGVTAPAYEISDSHTGFPMKHLRLCTQNLCT